MIRQTVCLAASLALLAGCAITRPPERSADTARPIAFILMDADESGALDRGEWEAYGNAMFDRLDLNGNGELRDREVDRSFEAFDLDFESVRALRARSRVAEQLTTVAGSLRARRAKRTSGSSAGSVTSSPTTAWRGTLRVWMR